MYSTLKQINHIIVLIILLHSGKTYLGYHKESYYVYYRHNIICIKLFLIKLYKFILKEKTSDFYQHFFSFQF